MATRNNGDDPPSEKGPGERPGSYVKIAGSRRRRRGRKSAPSVRPLSASEGQQPLDRAVGESERGSTPLDAQFEPAVDDLRAVHSPSSRAPRRSHGPLGMEDAHSERATAPEPTPSVAHVRVIEVNTPPRASDNTNAQPGSHASVRADLSAAPSHASTSHPPAASVTPADGDGDDRFASEEELPAPEPQPSPEPVPAARLVGHELPSDHAFGSGHPDATPRRGFSSVLNARASMRPSPPPPPRSALGWWLVILLLTGIIVAAVVVAVRERMDDDARAAEPVREEVPAPAAERVAPQPAVTPNPEPTEVAPEAPVSIADAAATTTDDAGAARPEPAPRVRVWKPRKPTPAAQQAPAPSTPSKPREAVPANPYAAP